MRTSTAYVGRPVDEENISFSFFKSKAKFSLNFFMNLMLCVVIRYMSYMIYMIYDFYELIVMFLIHSLCYGL